MWQAVVDAATRDLDREISDMEKAIVQLRSLGIDTSEPEKKLAELQRHCLSAHSDNAEKLSQLSAALDSLARCEHEQDAILQFMKNAEDQLIALEQDDSLSPDDKLKRQQASYHFQVLVTKGLLLSQL